MLPRMGQFAFNRPGMDRPQPGDSAAGTLQARSVNGAPNGVGSRSAVSADLGHRNPGKPVGAVVAATQVLRVHASERPLNASEVARAAGLHRGTAYNDDGKWRLTGGKRSTCGTPQGGVISPLLANLYMNRFLKYWRASGRSEAYQARIVAYADDFVILSRRSAAEALAWTRQVMTKLGLALNEAKTAVRDARRELFDFLGYSFGPHRYRKDGHWYLGASPSKKSVLRLKAKVSDLMVPGNMGTWPEVRDRLNRLLRGWAGYFSHGTRMPAYRAVDNHVYERVRNFLMRRHKVPTRGTNRFNDEAVFGALGVLRLRRIHLGPPPCAAR